MKYMPPRTCGSVVKLHVGRDRIRRMARPLKICSRLAVLGLCILLGGCGRYPGATILVEANDEAAVTTVLGIVTGSGFIYERRIDPAVRHHSAYFGPRFGYASPATLLCAHATDCEVLITIYKGEDGKKAAVSITQKSIVYLRLRGEGRRALNELVSEAKKRFGEERIQVLEN